ncbi:alpha/beta fold hydrolase [Brevibacillus fluminis]|uniref:alpha/beta fold hydrolase n=1 Tax=Brevibacillus fluminis TaxID=511487 RepID=UPI003F89F116
MGAEAGMDMKTIRVAERTIAYREEGSGTALLLLHGFCGSHAYWDKVVPELAKEYRVLAPDLPGHGGTSHVEGAETIDAMADEVKFLLDQAGADKVILLGHSLGGYLALSFAQRYRDRLLGFGLIHSTAYPDSPEAKKGRDANIEKVGQQGINALIDGLIPKLFSPEHLADRKADVEEAKRIGYQTSPEGAIAALRVMKERPDRNQVLHDAALPILLVAGEQDQLIPADKTFSVTKENITQALIKDVGHMSMMESPDQLIAELRPFLRRCADCSGRG